MDDAFNLYFPADNGLLCLFGTIGNDFRINHNLKVTRAASLKNTENRGFAIGVTTSLSFDPLGSEV
jgi:hypothetical protein